MSRNGCFTFEEAKWLKQQRTGFSGLRNINDMSERAKALVEQEAVQTAEKR